MLDLECLWQTGNLNRFTSIERERVDQPFLYILLSYYNSKSHSISFDKNASILSFRDMTSVFLQLRGNISKLVSQQIFFITCLGGSNHKETVFTSIFQRRKERTSATPTFSRKETNVLIVRTKFEKLQAVLTRS